MADRFYTSIVIPVFNEAANLEKLLEKINDLRLPGAEIIVVDDGSTDDSAVVAAQAGATVVRHPYNIGNGAAIKSGIRAARSKFLVFMDGDGQHKPEDIPKLLKEAENFHMVVGARSKGSKLRFHRNVANLVYNFLATYVTQFPVKDLTSGFRVLERLDALRFIDLLPNTFSYPTTLTLAFLRSGLTVKYLPIQTLYRSGQSKISLVTDGVRFLIDHHQDCDLIFAVPRVSPREFLLFLHRPGELSLHFSGLTAASRICRYSCGPRPSLSSCSVWFPNRSRP